MGHLISRWKQEWHRFSDQPAGRRFEDRYERRRSRRAGSSLWRKALNIGGGILLLLVGAFFAVAPGPAVVFFALGGLLIAKESRLAARFLDWIDRRLEPVIAWVVRRWKRLTPLTQRVVKGCAVVWTVAAVALGVVFLR